MSVFFVACKGMSPLREFPANFWANRPQNTIFVRGNRESPRITEGLVEGWVYRYDEERVFKVAKSENEMTEYVEKLATVVRYNWQMPNADQPGPFREFLRYAGDFGTISGSVSAKLADDFCWWDERVQALGDSGFHAWFLLMREVFAYAAKEGAVWYLEPRLHRETLPRLAHHPQVAVYLDALRAIKWHGPKQSLDCSTS
jgi:hypothetical protein